ncbi:MAG: LicD family protein, partial [Muribaculaceae bacterium]|nr:LicD family protein [Muribaculaceae bacterium]
LKKYDYTTSNQVADYDDGMRGIIGKEILGNPQTYTFEGRAVKGVERYDSYLKNKSGDYMTIPKEANRRQHNFHFLDLEHPYKDFTS